MDFVKVAFANRRNLITVLLAINIPGTVALTQQYCSTQNTGSDSAVVSNNYQSNGACSTSCAGYAFAVVQYKSCWCSNYIPASTTETGSCGVACPGYPYENCGDASSGLFGYVALGKAPLGTQGAFASSSPKEDATTSQATQATQATVQAVSTKSLPGVPFGSSSPPVLASSSTDSTVPVLRPSLPFPGPPTLIPAAPISFETHFLTPSAQNSSPEPSPVTVQSAVTASQPVQISYVSITPSTTSTSTSSTHRPTLIPVSTTLDPPTTSFTSTATPTPTPTTSTTPTTATTSTTSTTSTASTTPTTAPTTTSSPSSRWSATPWTSVMTVTGQVITRTITPTAPPPGATTIVAAAPDNNGGFWSNKAQVGGIFFLVAVIVIAIVAAILFFLFRRSRPSDVATIQSTTGNNTPQRRPSRLSQMGLIGGVQRQATVPSIQTSGWGPGNSTEKSPADTMNADRRSSYAKAYDQRLEPTALWNPLHNNGSHNSIQSFRDDQDYSRRMLRITNPSDSEL